MTEPATQPEARRPRAPVWLAEGLDIMEQRRGVMLGVTGIVIAIGIALTLLVPSLLPPVAVVGAAVAVAAMLLGLAAAVAVDTTDLTVRGPRHVGAAGGELVAVLPTRAQADAATELAAAVFEAREPGKPLLLGLAAAGRDGRPTSDWTDALAIALVRQGASVLRIDLATGRSPAPGLIEVLRDGVKLTEAVTFEPGLRFARLGAGDDHGAALEALATLPGRLPKDLDVLLVVLPTAASRPVVAAVRALDHVLIVAQRDRTSRVDLIAGLDALEAAGTQAQVALLDDRTSRRLGLVTLPDERVVASTVPPARPIRPDDSAGEAPVPGRPAPEASAEPDEPVLDEPEPDEPALDEPELDETALDEPGLDEPTLDESEPALDERELDEPEPAGPAPQEPAPGEPDPQEPLDAAAAPNEPEQLRLDPGERRGGELPAPEPGGGVEPAADAQTPPRDGDHDAALGPRDVDLMLDAREAAAAALVEAPPAELPVAEPVADAVPGVAGTPDDRRRGTDTPVPTEHPDEDTEELPSVSRPQPVSGADADREDLLRTTAQLAHLLDDLDVQPDEQPHDQPSPQGWQP